MLNRAIEKAQRRVEGHNFDIRKNLLEYDDVANDQRQIIYQQRNELMEATGIADMVADIRHEVVDDIVAEYIPPRSIEEQWDVEGLEQALQAELGIKQPVAQRLEAEDDLNEDSLRTHIAAHADEAYEAKAADWAERGIDIHQIEKRRERGPVSGINTRA